MKIKNLYPIALFSCVLSFTSCSDDDHSVPMEDQLVIQAFEQKYPNANPSWENEQGYFKAEFYENDAEKDAWFTPAGEWVYTETDLSYQQLPTAVKKGFESSAYAKWQVEDVDLIERSMTEPVYIIEVEQGNQEYDLHFSVAGMLLKEVADTDNDDNYLPSMPTDPIAKSVKEKYPSAQILDIENEHNGMEVDILDNGIHKEVLFNAKSQWMYTTWEILPSSLPTTIIDAVKKLGFDTVNIDEAEVIEHNDGKTYYKVELERGEEEKDVYFLADGKEVTNPTL